MKYHLPIATAIIALSISAQAQAKKEPLRLKQTSQWNVDYANERCRLIRKFGEGEELAYIVFDRFGPGDKFRLTVAGKSLKTSIDHGEAIVQFGPTEGEQRLSFSHGSFGELPALLFDSQTRVAPPSAAELAAIEKAGKDKDAIWIDLAPVDPARLGAIRNLTIGRPFRQTVVLETGSMQKPLEALGKCVDDLMTTWGIDVEKHKALSKVATPASSPGTWILSRDYPKKMLSAGQPAIVEFRLSVSADGVPTSCHIQLTTRPKEFDAAVCDSLMRRARFTPALDAEGKPLISYYLNTVKFALP